MSSMFCNQIYQCKNADWCARDFNPKSDCPECFEQLTNYDRLVSKTPEELAKYLTQAWYDGPVFECPARSSVGVDRCAEVKDCEDCFLDWLRSPVEEVDNG